MDKITEVGIFNDDWPVGRVVKRIVFDPPINVEEESDKVARAILSDDKTQHQVFDMLYQQRPYKGD